MTELLSIAQWTGDFSILESLSDGIDTLINQSAIPNWVTILHIRRKDEQFDLPGNVEFTNDFHTDQIIDYLKEHAQKEEFLSAVAADCPAMQIRFTIPDGYETLYVIPTENLLDVIREVPELTDAFVTSSSPDEYGRYLHDLATYNFLYKLAISQKKAPLKSLTAALLKALREQEPTAFKKVPYIDPKQYPVGKRQDIACQAAIQLRERTALTGEELYELMNQLLPAIPGEYLESVFISDTAADNLRRAMAAHLVGLDQGQPLTRAYHDFLFHELKKCASFRTSPEIQMEPPSKEFLAIADRMYLKTAFQKLTSVKDYHELYQRLYQDTFADYPTAQTYNSIFLDALHQECIPQMKEILEAAYPDYQFGGFAAQWGGHIMNGVYRASVYMMPRNGEGENQTFVFAAAGLFEDYSTNRFPDLKAMPKAYFPAPNNRLKFYEKSAALLARHPQQPLATRTDQELYLKAAPIAAAMTETALKRDVSPEEWQELFEELLFMWMKEQTNTDQPEAIIQQIHVHQ